MGSLQEHPQGLLRQLDLSKLSDSLVSELEEFLANLVPVLVIKGHSTTSTLLLDLADQAERAEDERDQCVADTLGSSLGEGLSGCEVDLQHFQRIEERIEERKGRKEQERKEK